MADPPASADGVYSPIVDQEEFEDEMEEVEMEEVEEEDESEGEEIVIVENEEDVEAEVEDEEVEEEEFEGGDGEGELAEDLEDDVEDRVHEEFVEVEDEDEDNGVQNTEFVREEEENEDVREEDEMVVEGEGRDKDEKEAGFSSAEAANAVPDHSYDSYMKVNSEVHAKDQNSLSLAATDLNYVNHHAHDPSKVFINNGMEFNCKSVGNSNSVITSELPSEENGIPETLIGDKCKAIELEKEFANEAQEHGRNIYLESQGGATNESEIVNYNALGKGEKHLQGKNNSQVLKDSSLTFNHTPQRRLRSSSPDSEPDKTSKRLANICVFYARGWCIKGNSCKFLHQKDEATIFEHKAKGDKAEQSRTSNSHDIAGSDEIIECSKVSSSVFDTNHKGSSGSNSLLQRALVRAYGTGSNVSSQLHEHHDMHTKGEFWHPDHFPAGFASAREGYRNSLGKMNHIDSVGDKQLDNMLSKRQLIEGKRNEISIDNSQYDLPNHERDRMVDTFKYNSKQYSGSSSISYISHKNSHNISEYGRPEGQAFRSAQSNSINQESFNSPGLTSSLNSGLGDSFQLSHLDYKPSRSAISPTSVSSHKSKYLERHGFLDRDIRYHDSGPFSLTRNASPYHSRFDFQNMMPHSAPDDLAFRKTTKIQFDTWEPSQPFRSSLAIPKKSISSPASQYDPILDSIEPVSTNASDCYQSSALFRPTKSDNAITWEGSLAKNLSLHDPNTHPAEDVFFTSIKIEEEHSSYLNSEKVWNSDHLVERSNNKDADLGSEWRNLDKYRNSKESKALKIFQTTLVDFVKDLLKPWWREGQLSKDAHKTIVKKSVEKVLSALHSHQIPSTKEAINQYMASSKSKITKLVEGYVQKHANS